MDHQALLQRHSGDCSTYERRLESLNHDLHTLRVQLQDKEAHFSQVLVETDTYREKAFTLEGELSKRIEAQDLLTRDLRDLQQKYDELRLSQRGGYVEESAIQVELEQFRKDNERLMKML